MMTRTFLSALLVASALVGCNRDGSMHSEEPSQNATAQNSRQQQQPAPNPTVAEREEQREEAVEELPAQLSDTERARQRATEEAGRLTLLVNQACEGIASEEKDVCPLDPRHVRTVRDVENGVAVQLNPNAGDEAMIQRRVDCYAAIAQVRANEAAIAANPDPATTTPRQAEEREATAENPMATPRTECVLDVPTTSVEVARAPGGVRIELTSETEGYAVEIREQAHNLVPRRRGSAHR
jgi:glucose/arabinose dehydrogenase